MLGDGEDCLVYGDGHELIDRHAQEEWVGRLPRAHELTEHLLLEPLAQVAEVLLDEELLHGLGEGRHLQRVLPAAPRQRRRGRRARGGGEDEAAVGGERGGQPSQRGGHRVGELVETIDEDDDRLSEGARTLEPGWEELDAALGRRGHLGGGEGRGGGGQGGSIS